MITFKDVRHCSLLSTHHWYSPRSVTLTLKQTLKANNGSLIRLDENQCKKAIAVFTHHLDRAVYGNAALRYGKRVKIIPVLERSDAGRWHIHAAIELPLHIDPLHFARLIRRCWSKVDWAYRRIEARKKANQKWVNYMLKPLQKSAFENWSDCIVWECLHNPPIADA